MKRSANVVLAVMTATAVGATAYAMMPNRDCNQAPDGTAPAQSCRGTRGGSYHAVSSSSRDSGRSAAPVQGGSTGAALPASTQHGGFGSFARSIGSHLSGGS